MGCLPILGLLLAESSLWPGDTLNGWFSPTGARGKSVLNEPTPPNRNITADELVAAVVSLIVLIVPIFLVVVFPDNGIVSSLFGGGRIVAFWVFVYGFAYVFRKDIDRIGADWARRRKEKGS